MKGAYFKWISSLEVEMLARSDKRDLHALPMDSHSDQRPGLRGSPCASTDSARNSDIFEGIA